MEDAASSLPPGVTLLPHRASNIPATNHDDVAEAFWRTFKERSEHHGHYESTWAGIRAAIAVAKTHEPAPMVKVGWFKRLWCALDDHGGIDPTHHCKRCGAKVKI